MNNFLRALFIAAMPFVAMVVATAVMEGKGGELVWALGLVLCPLALLASGGFALAGKRPIALGILAAVGIGIVALILSCTVVLASPATLP